MAGPKPGRGWNASLTDKQQLKGHFELEEGCVCVFFSF